MTPDEKHSFVHIAVFWILMALITTEWFFGWPTNDQLSYFSIAWLVTMVFSSLYVWYLELKQ
jgi:hypothetical protein